ncbi:MAG: NUDIX hydrolase [Bacteroidales bacterium]|jgi:ADP-ribose pyrophosphatase YjhB (NUDIX family)|nr:NUDIX hydrolase [Bacteroidales bacterium]
MIKIYSKNPKFYLAVDCIIFGYDIIEKELKLLLIKRSFEPAKGKWSLSGGFVQEEESLDEAASRILFNLTGLSDLYMEQLYTYGDVNRDPGSRVISTAYFALIGINELDSEIQERNGAHWRSISNLPELIFDHREMVDRALTELINRIKVHPVGFELLPDKFTLVQLQNLYEAIYQRKIDKRNFRKKILSMNLLEKQTDKERETSRKGAWYFRFNEVKYKELTRNGFFFNLTVS